MKNLNRDTAPAAELDFVILYGSETGTGEEVAERCGREALRHGLDPLVSSMNSFDVRQLPLAKTIVFIASTTGQGEEPSNMKTFWQNLLKRSLPPEFLSNVSFTVLGLGDSSYVKFNFVAKKLFKRLKQLGASALTELCMGDDQHELGPDAVIDQWLLSVFTCIDPRYSKGMTEMTALKPKFDIVVNEVPYSSRDSIQTNSVYTCELVENKRVTARDHFQDVRLISIDLADSGLKYDPGDVLVVVPSNSDETVAEFFQLFPHLEAKTDEPYSLQGNWTWSHIPRELSQLLPFPWTWHQVARQYLDLQAIPKRYFFELLAHFTTSELEREKLIEFTTAAGQQDLYSYCNRPKRTVLEVLADFPHALANISPEYLFDLIPPIKPRSFSIASSMAAHGSTVQILVAVVNYRTKLKRPRLGLCSNWLARLKPGAKVPVWVERGSFHFPAIGSNQPLIMVGPGTGCAPFRSLISERAGTDLELTLFFGCRFSTKDFYFEEEWSQLLKQRKLSLFTAFSREDTEKGVMYVQHKIVESSNLIWDLIQNRNASIYVAGNAKRMPIDVADAFVTVFKKNGIEVPESYLKQLIKVNRYQTEVWS